MKNQKYKKRVARVAEVARVAPVKERLKMCGNGNGEGAAGRSRWNGDREDVEGRVSRYGRSARKEHPRWFCEGRQMATAPLTWSRFVPDRPDIGLPIGGATVLVGVGYAGRVLVIPRDYRYEETARLFRDLNVEWWSYMPAIPMGRFEESRVLSAGDFFYHARWEWEREDLNRS